MLVSTDRLKWTYGESLAADTQYWCQLLRNVHTQSQGWTHTTPTQHIALLLHISCPELLAVMVSDYLRTCSVQALWAFWNLLDFPASLLVKGRHPVWTLDRSDKCKATERQGEGRMGGKITAKELLAHSEQRALFKNRPPQIALYPFVSVFCLKGCVSAHFTCVAWCPFWPDNPFWGSQVDFCVKDKYCLEARLTTIPFDCSIVIKRPHTSSRTSCSLSYWSDSNWTCFYCFIKWWSYYFNTESRWCY